MDFKPACDGNAYNINQQELRIKILRLLDGRNLKNKSKEVRVI